jgi:hypothetical protein
VVANSLTQGAEIHYDGQTNLSAVPLPAAVLLFGSVIASLAGFGAWKKTRQGA